MNANLTITAAYALTALITPPDRLVYLSSGLHRRGDASLDDLQWIRRRWDGAQAYADSKLLDGILAFAVARRWPTVHSNALEPGWVPTRMGGREAPDDLALGAVTQAWLAVSNDAVATVTSRYFYHQQLRPALPVALDVDLQNDFLAVCARLSNIPFPDRSRES